MAYAIGIDVGGTTIKAAIISDTGVICDTAQVDTPQGTVELISAVAQLVADFRGRVVAGLVKDGDTTVTELIDTVGFDVPGIVNETTGIAEFSANLGWRNFYAKEILSKKLGTPVAFGHDVRSGALAESFLGVKLPHFFYIAIGTGIAATLIVNNRIMAPHPWAGEIGQTPVFPQFRGDETVSRVERFTSTLPVEQIASASAITRQAVELGLVAESGGAAAVYALADKLNTETELSTQELHAAKQAREIIDTAVATLAHTTAHFLAGIGPIPVVLGGGLANRGQELLDHFRAELETALGIVPVPEVHRAQLGSWSQVQGAALRAFIAEGLV